MRRGIIAAGSTVAGVATVLLLNPTGAPVVTAASDAATATSTTEDSASTSSTDDAAATEQSSTLTYPGDTVQTRWGAVQVSAAVTDGTLTSVELVQMPANDHHSAQISTSAGPVLVEQALSAQSADVDGVSGATYTSDGFRRSLQSALEQAGL